MKPKISGIYKITNKVNGKVYIGQSNDIKSRWNHEHGGKSTSNVQLKEDINNFGLESFSYEIIAEENNQQKKDELEKFYIKKLNSTNPELGYNISEGGFCGSFHSDEWKKEQSERLKKYYKENPNWLTEERREKLRKSGKRERTKEERKIMSERRKGFTYSEVSKKKMSESAKKRVENFGNIFRDNKEKHKEIIKLATEAKYKKVRCLETGEIFPNIITAREKYGKNLHITDCCKGKRKTAGGFHWEYINA